MSTGRVPVPLSFRRIVDIPFETCVAALDSRQRTGHRGELRFGGSQVLGPMEHDHLSGHAQTSGPPGPGTAAPTTADETGHRPLVRIVHHLGAHPLRARPAQRGLLPRRPSPA